ncbi:MAG: transcription-repair coupling factor [Bacillota bacterium]
MKGLLELFLRLPEMERFRSLWPAAGELTLTGLDGVQKTVFMAAIAESIDKNLVIITYSHAIAERYLEELALFFPGERLFYYPGTELWPHEPVMEIVPGAQRAKVLTSLARNVPYILVTTMEALARRTVPAQTSRDRMMRLAVKERLDLQRAAGILISLGYQRVEMIEGVGQFSLRGDILDIFIPTERDPVRLELFGEEIDTIRYFDLDTQRSIENLNEIMIWPAREYAWRKEDVTGAISRIRASLQAQVSKLVALLENNTAKRLEENIRQGLEQLEQGYFPGSEQFLPFFSPLAGLWEYFRDAAVIWDEPYRCRNLAVQQEKERADLGIEQLQKGLILPEELAFWLDFDEIRRGLASFSVVYLLSLAQTGDFATRETVAFNLPLPPSFHGKMESYSAELRRLKEEGYRVAVLLSTGERLERMAGFLTDQGFSFQSGKDGWRDDAFIVLVPGRLGGGILFPGEKKLLLTDQEIFGQAKKRRWVRRIKEGKAIRGLADLALNDYVVHVNHGIGQYMGIRTMSVAGIHRDYLEIKYAGDSDRLYVPVDQIGMLQKYLGGENGPPRLSKLGGNEWQRLKTKVRESVREIAVNLLQLYAERKNVGGYGYAQDTVWQREFEESFPYEETPDQLKATEEIKKDMEKSTPMDRLLCGDVGYGKTEVAMRAMFKTVMDQKQVAFLVPTTILAQQHYQTFMQRFAGFPINIGILSRFQTQRQQQRTLAGMASGGVDVVVGTHRLLSEDVKFKDLGLLVIDEEQRFGVMHKEKLKIYKKTTDVLTLTATPIPRTLHMSMIGVRDISTIETPPENRYPIRTFVEEYSEPVIVEAIHRELSRKGQIYFVYNRVETIDQMAKALEGLLPGVRFGIAHGQMPEEQLEQEMIDFFEGKTDCLICSTIIETGMDIPNANTLIVYDADQFGLSQLYQLRGRVGRSNRVAYAYFTFRKNRMLTEIAEKRLKTIKEFTALGSGLKIALRDLEIRGAGNLLGPEQHGFIANIGFELYCQMLEEAILERKDGTKKPGLPDVVLELNVDAYLPERYIRDERQRVEMYRKIATAQSLQELREIADELVDRFGDAPAEVQSLLSVASIRAMAKPLGISAISSERHYINVRSYEGLIMDRQKVQALLKHFEAESAVHFGKFMQIRFRKNQRTDREFLPLLIKLLGKMETALAPPREHSRNCPL